VWPTRVGQRRSSGQARKAVARQRASDSATAAARRAGACKGDTLPPPTFIGGDAAVADQVLHAHVNAVLVLDALLHRVEAGFVRRLDIEGVAVEQVDMQPEHPLGRHRCSEFPSATSVPVKLVALSTFSDCQVSSSPVNSRLMNRL